MVEYWRSMTLGTNVLTALSAVLLAGTVFAEVVEKSFFVSDDTILEEHVSDQQEIPVETKVSDTTPKSVEHTSQSFLELKKEEFIASGTKFVDVDLSGMILRLYDEGAVVHEFPILTKGRAGSWWETPIGLYEIQSRETDHFSSFGLVHQPWSLAFHGNFFIHGWPYYPDGTPVASTFSGGCVRLATEDAEILFHKVKTGVPVLVREVMPVEPVSYERAQNSALSPLSARAYIALDLDTGFVFGEKDSQEVLPIASITKLMTAAVALEQANLDHTTTVPPDALVYTSKPRFAAGDRIDAFELVYPLLTESSNEAAITLSNYFGHKRFISLMNAKAVSLGMQKTHFEDAAGRMDGNVASIVDLTILARYIHEYRKQIFDISAHDFGGNSFYGKTQFTDLSNFNLFADDAAFIGGKTGKTTVAKETMLALFTESVGGANRKVLYVVLGSENNKTDIEMLRAYVKNSFSVK